MDIQEAIKVLGSFELVGNNVFGIPQMEEARLLAINSFQENDKLKTEIEQWQSTNLEMVCELTRLECENNQLKKQIKQTTDDAINSRDILHDRINDIGKERTRLYKENSELKSELSHSIAIACEGCPKDNLSECMQEHCIRWIAKNHRDTMKSTIKDYYVED